jgi:hypothetical protein
MGFLCCKVLKVSGAYGGYPPISKSGIQIRDRQAGFESLRQKAKVIKLAVSAQCGAKYAEYTSIKSLKF